MAKPPALATYLTSNWLILTIQVILAILAGIAFVFWPGLSIVTLVYLFGAYVLATGILFISTRWSIRHW